MLKVDGFNETKLKKYDKIFLEVIIEQTENQNSANRN